MRLSRFRVVGLTAAVLVILMFSALIFENEFPAYKYAHQPAKLVPSENAIVGQETSRFLWDYRVLDLIGQAFVLFAAAVCCGMLLKVEGRKK